ncbi:MAG TPA: acyl-[acyl-carrier-protein]--UDP-N-acetylglucosamine O-acyltransferase, partial [bacterium]|nr:acyl-[acyl-carrier-protein]--UDP-N-acetylglucosamine O-acyltransferase [bacterium]
PFFTGKGLDDFSVQSVNAVGLSRRGFSEETVRELKNAYKLLYVKKGLVLKDAVDKLKEQAKDSAELAYLLDFILSSKTGIVR